MLALPLVLALAGCGARPGSRVERGVETMKTEKAPDKLLERGKAFAQVGDFTRAEQYLATALDAGADPAVVLPLLLRVCTEGQRYRVAIDYAEQHLRKHPGDQRLRFLVATMYLAIGETAGARERLEVVVAASPKDAAARFALASVLRDMGEPVLADRHFRVYLELEPKGTHVEEARASLLKEVR